MTNPPPQGRSWGRAARLTGVAWEFLSSILAGAILGYVADRHLASGPWGIALGTVLGSVLGLYRMVVILRQLDSGSRRD